MPKIGPLALYGLLLAVARAALREPNLPAARLDGPEGDVRLLTNHREALIAERTRIINRLRWHLYELDPTFRPGPRSLDRASAYDKVATQLACHGILVARLATDLLMRLRDLTAAIDALAGELDHLVKQLAPSLLAIPGCGTLTATKIIGETAGVARFATKDTYARYNGTAPLPVWSFNHERHRLSRVGNRQLNAALHRIALTQAHWHPPARALLARRKENGDGGLEALRILKRRLSGVVYTASRADTAISVPASAA